MSSGVGGWNRNKNPGDFFELYHAIAKFCKYKLNKMLHFVKNNITETNRRKEWVKVRLQKSDQDSV